MADKPNLFQRLNAIKKAIGYIQKDKKVDTYMAVTHDMVTALTRDHFIEHGVIVSVSEVSSQVVLTSMMTSKGTPFIRFEGLYAISFINVDDGNDAYTIQLTAHALDQGDKSPQKATSMAVKAAILKTLQLESGDDEESRVAAVPMVDVPHWSLELRKAATMDDLRVVWKAVATEVKAKGDKVSGDALKLEMIARGEELQKLQQDPAKPQGEVPNE